MISCVLDLILPLIREDCEVISEEYHSIEGKEIVEEDSGCHVAASI